MIKPWQYRTTQDQLLVFVSSRIQECKEERSVAQEAIRSLRHQPILFEHLGAKPYPARDLYLSRLRDSQIMVAIYRLGYGYVDAANGMKISGLEDEFRFAEQNGIDTLVYVLRSEVERDPRLVSLISEIEGRTTVSFYSRPEDLRDRVADDLTALTTQKYFSAKDQQGVLQEDASDVLARALSRVGVVVRRGDLLQRLAGLARGAPVVCIYGPPGIGKTTLAAQFAQATTTARFVRATGLAPKEVFAVCAARIQPGVQSGVQSGPRPAPQSYSTINGARMALAAAWAESAAITLIVDECDFVDELIDALATAGGASAQKQLLFTSREPTDRFQRFEVPPLTSEETNEILAKSSLAVKELPAVVERNPLHLHNQLLQAAGPGPLGVLQAVEGSASEMLEYIAVSPVPLSAEQLLKLRADSQYSIQSLTADVARVAHLVEDSPRGYRLAHAEITEPLVKRLRESPQRCQFFVNRLVRLFDEEGKPRFAYELAASQEDGSERKYEAPAIREAARLGDWRFGVRLIDRMLNRALDDESKSEALQLMLSLIYPLEIMGDAQRAASILERARGLAKTLGGEAKALFEEAALGSKARRALSAADVAALEEVYRHYGQQGKEWQRARLGLELSAIYMAAKGFEKARDILRPTITAFEAFGDEYGADLAQKNMAMSLSAIPGAESEAERLIAAIEERARGESDVRRQRAWICNILIRRLRTAGRYSEAAELAKEAIAIATDLGDESLRAINSINLGNALRGGKDPQQAIAAYEEAAIAAQKCDRLDIQADASRFIAGVLNDFEETGADRYKKAAMYSQHAIGLLRGTVYYEALARAYWELADAQHALRDREAATRAMFEAANVFRLATDNEEFANTLVAGAQLGLEAKPAVYLEGLCHALGVKPPEADNSLAVQFVEVIRPIMERAPRGALIPLLGSHLNEVSSHLTAALRRGLTSAAIEILRDCFSRRMHGAEQWRVLHSGIALAALMKETTQPYLQHRLSASIMESVQDVFVREEGDGSRVWTIVLDLNGRVTVSIASLDVTPDSNLAGLALATFIKAFEADLSAELLGGVHTVSEVQIQIGRFDRMPRDLQELTATTLGLDAMLKTQACTVSRPTKFDETSPTLVFLSPSFLDEVSIDGRGGGALQLLFGLTLVEIVFQLLRGQVELDVIKPKVVSLVRQTAGLVSMQ